MPANSQKQWKDPDIVEDAIMLQSDMAQGYLSMLDKSTTPNLRNELIKLLTDEEEISYELGVEEQKRGWTAFMMADQAQMDMLKQKYTNQNIPSI
ncbi:MAG TPA: hypothetical protein DEP42_06425 [Ruminococcaceae bacterium]|nr:hypothetical protein [Oscillospiraceae bacterium]